MLFRSQNIALLNAMQSVSQAKANNGPSVSFNARFGLSNDDSNIASAYSHLKDQEILGLSVSLPIADWGMGRGRIKMAKSREEKGRSTHGQGLIDYRVDLVIKVMPFNNQRSLCEVARRAAEVATESCELSRESFLNGNINVMELNQLQNAKDNAVISYLKSIQSFWNYYFTLRKIGRAHV